MKDKYLQAKLQQNGGGMSETSIDDMQNMAEQFYYPQQQMPQMSQMPQMPQMPQVYYAAGYSANPVSLG